MSTMRSLKRQAKDEKPIILFSHDKGRAEIIADELYKKYNVKVLAVADPEIYSRIKEGIDNAIATNQHDVIVEDGK